MRDFFVQIRRGLDANLYYLSLSAALMVPDICGAMESEDGRADGSRYKSWFDRYVADRYGTFFTADDCWRFRCSMLHQGTSRHPSGGYDRIFFVEPSTSPGVLMHLNVFDNCLNIDVRVFCNDIVDGAERWLDEVETSERYQNNYYHYMKRHPNGLLPYVSGVPVIG